MSLIRGAFNLFNGESLASRIAPTILSILNEGNSMKRKMK